MKLFQYWDTGEPPQDVAGWVEGFRVKNPEMQHRLYDRDRASWFIGKHFSERERRAFDALAVPAMQADYFRLCALVAKGGVWFDADCLPGRPLSTLIARAPSLLLVLLDGAIINSTLIARRPGSPFLTACLGAATRIIEGRLFGDAIRLIAVPSVAGPGLLTAAWFVGAPEWPRAGPLGRCPDPPPVWSVAERLIDASPAFRASVSAATFLHLYTVEKWGRPTAPSYKDGPRHGMRWQGSVYLDDPTSALAV